MRRNRSEPLITNGNNLLRALRAEDLALLEPICSGWDGSAGDVLYEPGDGVHHVFFPCGPSVVSFQVLLRDGAAIETALVGREGAVGGVVSRGRLPAYVRAVVQFPGPFLRIETARLEEAKARSKPLADLFSRYADCLLAQVFQSTACNAAHTIEQRTARWLLATVDRTGDHIVPLTQEQLAGLLGVGRSYASRVVQTLKRRGVLETRRGCLEILDFEALCAVSCDCQNAIRDHFDAVLADVYPVEHGLSDCRADDDRPTRPRPVVANAEMAETLRKPFPARPA